MNDVTYWLNIAFAAVLLALITWLGTRGIKEKTEEDFLIGGRSIPWWMLAGTISAGIIGGGVLLVFSEYVYTYGISAFCIIGGIVLGTLLIVPVANRFKPLADRQAFYTLPDLFAHEWGRTAGLLSTIIVGFWTLCFIVMQLVSAGKVLQSMTGWPYWIGVIVAACAVGSYLILSGFRAVVITDVLQYLALLLLLLIAWPFAVSQVSWKEIWSTATTTHLEWGKAVGFFVLGCLNMIVSADLWQRIYAARTVRDAKLGIRVAAGLVFVIGVLLFMLPLYAKIMSLHSEANQALIDSLNHLLPRWMFGFALVGVLSTVIATLDTMVFILGVSIGHDIRVRQLGMPVANRIQYTRLAMVLCLACGVVASILFPQLLEIGFALSTLGLVLAPPLLMRLTKHMQPSHLGVNMSLIAGLVAVVLIILVLGLTPENTLFALVASVIGLIVGDAYTWLCRKQRTG